MVGTSRTASRLGSQRPGNERPLKLIETGYTLGRAASRDGSRSGDSVKIRSRLEGRIWLQPPI
jgi:hypothetical protein